MVLIMVTVLPAIVFSQCAVRYLRSKLQDDECPTTIQTLLKMSFFFRIFIIRARA